MRAIVQKSYGHPEHLELIELEKPVPSEGKVRVRVMASAINDYDWSMVRGKPWIYRLMFGLTKPRHPTPGMELAGIVDACGSLAEKWKVGDRVYGDISEFGFGTFADYIVVDQNALCLIPGDISFVAAASIPHAALLESVKD